MKELSAWLAANTPLESEPGKFVELYAAERMRVLGHRTMAQYVAHLDGDPREARNLFQHMAPPETWLFRYLAAFETLRDELAGSDRTRMIRVASLGCAGGSEPFSIAATALACGLTGAGIRILALDYSDEHLEVVRSGRISPIAQRTPIPAWAARWFHPTSQGQLELDAQGLDMIDLVQADLATWKPAHRFDFVFCRNVAIYLNQTTKRSLGRRLLDMLQPRGVLFLGHADSAILAGTDARRLEIPHAFAFAKSTEAGAKSAPPITPVASAASPRRGAASAKARLSAIADTTRTPPANPADGLLARARTEADAGNLAAAERTLLSHLALHPAELEAHLLLGGVHMARNQFDEAERAFTKVVYLDPGNSLGLLSLATIADMRGDAQGAERFRNRAARSAVEPRRE